jgi:hypothetical protein
MTIWSDNKDLGGFVEKLTTISQKQIQVESFTIPANYKKEYQKAEWIKIINALKKSMV